MCISIYDVTAFYLLASKGMYCQLKVYPLVGGQWCYGWMNISQTLLIRKWGAGTPTPTTVGRGPFHYGLSTETAWRAQPFTCTSQEQSRDLNREQEKEMAKSWDPCSHRTKEGQNQHRSKSKLRPQETIGDYVQLRRTGVFLEWHPGQEL